MGIASMYFIYFVVVRDWSIAVSRALTSQSRATLSRGNTNENCATFDNGFCSRAWQVARGKESKYCIAHTEAAFRSHLTVLTNWNVKHINTYIWYNPACKWIVKAGANQYCRIYCYECTITGRTHCKVPTVSVNILETELRL